VIDRKRSLLPAEGRSLVPYRMAEPGCDEKLDQALDEALQETFPASDPVAVTAPRRCGG
jgi:hypothetical protein